MKKIIGLLILLVLFAGCVPESSDLSEVYLGIIETSSTRSNSTIIFYDENLNVIKKTKSNTAELGTNFSQACYFENFVYIVPRGLMGRYDDKVVLEIDADTKKVKEYSVDRINLQRVAANDKYIAVTSNLNLNHYISLIDKKTEKIKETSTKNMIELIVFVNEKLYSFESNEYASMINIYSEDLTLIESIDISHIGHQHNKYAVNDGCLYFSNAYLNDQDHNTISVLDTKTNKLITEELDNMYPSDIVVYGDDLIVAHTKEVQPNGTKISVLDKKTLKTKYTYDLNHEIMRIEIKDTYLCVLSPRTDDGSYSLALFDIENNFQMVKQISLDGKNYYYYSTVFVNNANT